MSSSPRLLTPELIDEYTVALRAVGVSVFDRLRPGLSDSQIDELVAPLGVRLPDELRAWWRWQNGVELQLGLQDEENIAPGMRSLPLAEVVEYHVPLLAQCQAGVEDDLPTEQAHWRPSWIPFAKSSRHVVCECGGEPDQPAPVRYLYWESESHLVPSAPSIGETLMGWKAMIEQGRWTIDEDGLFEHDHYSPSQPGPTDWLFNGGS